MWNYKMFHMKLFTLKRFTNMRKYILFDGYAVVMMDGKKSSPTRNEIDKKIILAKFPYLSEETNFLGQKELFADFDTVKDCKEAAKNALELFSRRLKNKILRIEPYGMYELDEYSYKAHLLKFGELPLHGKTLAEKADNKGRFELKRNIGYNLNGVYTLTDQISIELRSCKEDLSRELRNNYPKKVEKKTNDGLILSIARLCIDMNSKQSIIDFIRLNYTVEQIPTFKKEFSKLPELVKQGFKQGKKPISRIEFKKYLLDCKRTENASLPKDRYNPFLSRRQAEKIYNLAIELTINNPRLFRQC